MLILINGFAEKVPQGVTIARLIALFHEDDPALIVERNGRFVHPRTYSFCTAQEGDRIEFIKANIGG